MPSHVNLYMQRKNFVQHFLTIVPQKSHEKLKQNKTLNKIHLNQTTPRLFPLQLPIILPENHQTKTFITGE